MTVMHEPQTKAFNMGCDARLAGLPITANPHNVKILSTYWRMGWEDVDVFWGKKVRGRWPYMALQAVKEVA